MRYFCLIICFQLVSFYGSSQISDSLNRDAAPSQGLDRLILEYYKIDFNQEQRNYLADKELELIYLIENTGEPLLEEVKGIEDPVIIDSLVRKTMEIPWFSPRLENGQAASSIYFIKFSFPSYDVERRLNFIAAAKYREASMEDFEHLHKSNQRVDLLFSGQVNQFIGNPAKHLQTGGGMKVDVSVTAKNQLEYGLVMSFYGNKLKRSFPINSSQPEFDFPPTLLIGFSFGKWFLHQQKERLFNLRLEMNYAIQNLTERAEDTDEGWVQLQGFSPGLVLNYPFRLGKEKPRYYYGSPTISSTHLNLHLGIRPMFVDLKAARGVMMEFGVGIRLAYESVDEYKLKQSFLDQD